MINKVQASCTPYTLMLYFLHHTVYNLYFENLIASSMNINLIMTWVWVWMYTVCVRGWGHGEGGGRASNYT